MPINANLFKNIPKQLPEELVEVLCQSRHVRIERIVSKGHTTAEGYWYDQAWDEWVILLSGRATIVYEQEPQPVCLYPGDYILIPAHVRHRVNWTQEDVETVWLAVHFAGNT